ncbi:Crp/Fnr family transcriptional regulator [Halomonas sp. Bachu 37]|uniref:Crp/Fnr family transcriptional regulator n=1 Tax=Halomonas kashgarensis TaxID=3084920 RepID=UPI003216BB64
MAVSFNSPGTLMIHKLESIFSLADEEKQAIEELPIQVVDLKSGQDIVRIGDHPTQSCLVLAGFTCVYKLTSEGKRQIMTLHVPGDIPDLQSLHLNVMDMSIASISPCTVGFIQHENLRDLCERYPRIGIAFWRETLVDASVYREWLLSVGQRDAYPRMAHLFCELLMRLKAVGLVDDNTFELPITQADLADATGITSVHMNRVFQALRADGLIQTQGAQVTFPDWEKLKEAGDFDPLYLHLERASAA